MSNLLNKRVAGKMEKNESKGLLVITFHQLDLIDIGAYYPPRIR